MMMKQIINNNLLADKYRLMIDQNE